MHPCKCETTPNAKLIGSVRFIHHHRLDGCSPSKYFQDKQFISDYRIHHVQHESNANTPRRTTMNTRICHSLKRPSLSIDSANLSPASLQISYRVPIDTTRKWSDHGLRCWISAKRHQLRHPRALPSEPFMMTPTSSQRKEMIRNPPSGSRPYGT